MGFTDDYTVYLSNITPAPESIGVLEDTLISFDITCDFPIIQNQIRVYIDGDLAYNGSTFVSPFNISGSAITNTSTGGRDGYNLVIKNSNTYDNFVNVSLFAPSEEESIDTSWAFLIDTEINTVYFCDGYGAKKIDVRDLVGESQEKVRTFLSTTSVPSIPHNSIASMHGNRLDDGYFYLALSYNNFTSPDGYGVYVVKNELTLDFYSDGYSCYKAQITDDGIMYLINKDLNRIEVYYSLYQLYGGAPRAPDFIYSSASTPSIMAGEILTLHVVSGASTKYVGGTRLYIGTENGMNRIECYDKQNPDGTPFGTDSSGVSYTYTISSGSGTYKTIGGTIPKVTSISSDEVNNIFMVVTQDGAGNGGVTQISLTNGRKIVYMTHESGSLPSNDIRDIFGVN